MPCVGKGLCVVAAAAVVVLCGGNSNSEPGRAMATGAHDGSAGAPHVLVGMRSSLLFVPCDRTPGDCGGSLRLDTKKSGVCERLS